MVYFGILQVSNKSCLFSTVITLFDTLADTQTNSFKCNKNIKILISRWYTQYTNENIVMNITFKFCNILYIGPPKSDWLDFLKDFLLCWVCQF